MSNVSISGAISGLDTATMVNQLMSIEAQSQTAIKTRQAAAKKASDAYGSLITSLKSLAAQSATLAKTSAWQGSVATSSNTTVTATTTGNAVGTITFDVDKIAKAHTLISNAAGTPAASTGAVIAVGGTLTVNNGVDGVGSLRGTIDVGGGTLAEVVSGINSSDLGLRASAIQTAPGEFRLQVTSTTSGAASAFGLAGLIGPANMDILTSGTNAELTVGTNPLTQYTVTSETNTFANLLPGVSLTVSKEGETNVTVDAKLDGSAVATQISTMVDATNAALTALAASTAYDFSTRTGAALYGDNGIRGLQQQILSAVSGAAAPGVQLTRDGKLTFDKSAFTKAFAADPVKTANAYGATSSFSPNTGVLGTAAMILSTASTRAGTYEIAVSVNSAKEQWTTPNTSLTARDVVLTKGALTASYHITALETDSEALAHINTAAAAAGIGVTASISAGNIVFTADSAGTASAFSVTLDAVAGTKTIAGRDIVGTIDGEEATGIGSVLSLTSDTSQANGLSVDVSVSNADVLLNSGVIGDITFKPGLAQSLSTLLSDVTNKFTGSLTRAQQSRTDDIKDFQAQIDAWDIRLATRRATLTRQFTAMETALASLKSSSSAITNLLAATAANANA